jgi:hypothetical protein
MIKRNWSGGWRTRRTAPMNSKWRRGQQWQDHAWPCPGGSPWREESANMSNHRYDHRGWRHLTMNSNVVAKNSTVNIGCTEIIWRKCENKSEEERLGTYGRHLGSHWYGLRREIGRRMPTIGIRCAFSIWEIKSTKWQIKSLNGCLTSLGVTFMFMSSRFVAFNG